MKNGPRYLQSRKVHTECECPAVIFVTSQFKSSHFALRPDGKLVAAPVSKHQWLKHQGWLMNNDLAILLIETVPGHQQRSGSFH